MRRRPLTDRFWEKVDKNGPIMPGMDTPCWVWTAFKNDQGYGMVKNEVGKAPRMILATTAAWLLEYGTPVPGGLCICHGCDNPPCVREAHFFLGTRTDNNLDRDQKGRHVPLIGVQHTNSKLTDQIVKDIRKRYAAGGVIQAILAEEYGVSVNLVSLVVQRKIWAHVEG